MKISAAIIAFNEEKKIAQAIKSVAWADEILLVDSESTDRTREIAEHLGARILTKKWQGFSRQKQFATDSAAYDWVFSLDADERVSEDLAKEILRLKNSPENELADRPIKHGGWYPDWQMRFFNRQKGIWKDVLIHESVQMMENARIEKLTGDILHYSVENVSHHHQMIGERYAPLAAKQMYESGRRTSTLKIASVGFTTFFQNYIIKLGFLDGLAGFCIARFAAHHSFLKHLLLWEMQTGKHGSKIQKIKS